MASAIISHPGAETTGGLALDTPSLARARELFGQVINGPGMRPSTSSSIADRIEQVVCNGPDLLRPITEGVLSREFKVGRRIVRQTSRILQLRGILEPRRGGNGLGGLWVVTPTLDQALSAVGEELDLCGPADTVEEAGKWLAPAVAGRDDALGQMLRSLLKQNLRASAGVQSASAISLRADSLAGWLAARLLDEITLSRASEVALGSLASISADYGVSLEIAVEAVRILTDAQQVEVRRGRSGGVFSTAPQTGRALHIANAYLATNGVSASACREVLDNINTGMIELARERCSADGLVRIQRSFHLMQHAANGTELGKAWYGFIRDIADMADNPLLHFVARALASSILMRRTRSAELPDEAARELLAASRQILDHIGNAPAAPIISAQSRCQKALENYW
ncbi:hypothetical protein [Novosphingobium sp. 17-62-19]|uniref:FadR/GntR family transcriptional regulator n=1 Tax=Novosphingobium sp. 17-62-19 TaxID=1970406 RepID=UPI0025D3A1B2|nr:hypothetical protein [Novosphingobium sp. 17-62-19]HQS95505.1 hypothetical protein [Novosphingobium sp.]